MVRNSVRKTLYSWEYDRYHSPANLLDKAPFSMIISSKKPIILYENCTSALLSFLMSLQTSLKYHEKHKGYPFFH